MPCRYKLVPNTPPNLNQALSSMKEKKGIKNLQWKKTMEAGGVEAGASIVRRGLRFREKNSSIPPHSIFFVHNKPISSSL
jgi:hypothetical protein